MTMGPVPFEMVALAKAVAHWLSTSLPLAIAAPLLGFLVNLEPRPSCRSALAMVLGSIALSLLASIGAAVTVGLRRGGLAGVDPGAAALRAGADLRAFGLTSPVRRPASPPPRC